MIKYDEPILGENTNEDKKANFERLPNGEYVVEIEEIKEPVEVKIANAKVKLRDADNKIVRGEYTTKDNLEFVRFDVVLRIAEGAFEGRKIWTKLSTHPDYVWILKGLLYVTGNSKMTLNEIPTLVGTKVAVDTNTVDRTYTKTEIDPTTALETEVEKTTVKTFVNRYIKL